MSTACVHAPMPGSVREGRGISDGLARAVCARCARWIRADWWEGEFDPFTGRLKSGHPAGWSDWVAEEPPACWLRAESARRARSALQVAGAPGEAIVLDPGGHPTVAVRLHRELDGGEEAIIQALASAGFAFAAAPPWGGFAERVPLEPEAAVPILRDWRPVYIAE